MTVPTVLVVDDVPENLTVLGELLVREYTVRVANSGPAALRLAATHPRPDLILLDLMMPGMDGYQVMRHLQDDPLTCDIPVICVTALNATEEEERGLSMGAVDYITKPLRPPVVLARVRTQIELKRARPAHAGAGAGCRPEVDTRRYGTSSRSPRVRRGARAARAVLQSCGIQRRAPGRVRDPLAKGHARRTTQPTVSTHATAGDPIMSTCTPQRLLSPATLLLALASAAAVAAPSDVIWVDNESFALTGCTGSDTLPGSDDPQTLMRALRERGLADASQAVRLSGKPKSSVTLTPISASWRCDGAPSSVVFRMSTVDRNGQASTSHLVSRMPAPSTPVASNR